MKAYRVIFEREREGAWLARIPAVRGCHSYGRTLEQARERIREALGLFVRGASRARFEETVRLLVGLRRSLRRARRARERSRAIEQQAIHSTTTAARQLTKKLSLRDAGDLLGLSRQRVQQLLRDRHGRRGDRKATAAGRRR